MTTTERKKTGTSDFANRVKTLRESRNLTQAKLADSAGISLSLVREIEHGTRFGRKETHERLAQALDVSTAYLVYGSEQPDTSATAISEFVSWLVAQTPSQDDLTKLREIAQILFRD